MTQNDKKYVTSNVKIADIILENPLFLLLLEHFEIDFLLKEKTIEQICAEKNFSVPSF